VAFGTTSPLNAWGYSAGTFTAPATGTYLINYFADIFKNAGGGAVTNTVVLQLNGVTMNGTAWSATVSNSAFSQANRTLLVALNSGDTVKMVVSGTNPGVTNAGPGGISATLTIVRIQ
jgi:hypothetical protein